MQGGYTPEGLAYWAEHRERQRESLAEGGMLHLLDKSFNSQTLTSEDEKNVNNWDKMEREKERKKNKKEKRKRKEDAERDFKRREHEEKGRRKKDAKKRESEERIRVFKVRLELDEALCFEEAKAEAAFAELDFDDKAGDVWVSNPDDVPVENPIENDGMAAAVVWNNFEDGRGRRGIQVMGNHQVDVLRPRRGLPRQDEARSVMESGEANIWGPDEEEDDNLLAQALLLPDQSSGERGTGRG